MPPATPPNYFSGSRHAEGHERKCASSSHCITCALLTIFVSDTGGTMALASSSEVPFFSQRRLCLRPAFVLLVLLITACASTTGDGRRTANIDKSYKARDACL